MKKYFFLLLLLFIPFVFRDKKNVNKEKEKEDETKDDDISINTDTPKIIEALKAVKNEYGSEIAENVERIYRLETAHFKSTQFKGTGSAGMHAFNDNFPFGWGNEMREFIKKYPKAENGFFIKTYTESGTGRKQKYLGFKNIKYAFLFLAFVIDKRGNPASWHTLNKEKQIKYLHALKNVTPLFFKNKLV